MQTLLIIAVIVLSMIILAVAVTWYYRDRRVRKQDAPVREDSQRRYRDARWDAAVRAARNRNAF